MSRSCVATAATRTGRTVSDGFARAQSRYEQPPDDPWADGCLDCGGTVEVDVDAVRCVEPPACECDEPVDVNGDCVGRDCETCPTDDCGCPVHEQNFGCGWSLSLVPDPD